MTDASRAEYARRMNRVLNHIETHMDQAFDGEQLADVANFSRFHFHRIFAAWMGETLGSYVRRRRLEKAAFHLSCSAKPILEIALATGFGSGEAMSRAFKLHFGCTPTDWRARKRRRGESNPDQAMRNIDQANEAQFHDHAISLQTRGENSMEVRVIDLPAARVAYQRRIGAYGPGIGEFWRSTIAPWMASHGLEGETCYGVGYDDPSLTPADKCRYDACVEVPPAFKSSGQADITTLPGGRYAVARFSAQPATIAQAWMWLTRDWLPSSGLQCDDRPCFEMFNAATAVNPDTGEFTCDICIPVRPL